MLPDGSGLFFLAILVGLASYLQAMTGFAFGLVFMCGVALTGVISLSDGAAVVTVVFLASAAPVLIGDRRQISGRVFALVTPPALILTVAGTLLLPLAMRYSIDGLKLVLGLLVVASSIRLLFMPRRQEDDPAPAPFVLSGLFGGLMGGLFALPGPPIVYVLQSRMAAPARIRATLVAIFGSISLMRVLVFAATQPFTPRILLLSLILTPLTLICTAAARRWPLPVSPAAARGLTVGLLILAGLALALPALI